MSIDYGQKRTGLAVTDPLQLIANGLATVATPDVLDFVLDYVRRDRVERVVVGRPRQTDGTQAMLDGGLKKKARQNKALVDEISATIILQGWMESRRMGMDIETQR